MLLSPEVLASLGKRNLEVKEVTNRVQALLLSTLTYIFISQTRITEEMTIDLLLFQNNVVLQTPCLRRITEDGEEWTDAGIK